MSFIFSYSILPIVYKIWFEAACDNDIATLKECLADGVDMEALVCDKVPNFRYKMWKNSDNPALILAAGCGCQEACEFLLQMGADINAVSKDGLGVLHTTILLGQLEMARYFIAKEADIDLCSPDGQTPLSLAIMLGHDDLAEELIENNANCQIRNREGYSAYDIAIMLDNQKVVNSLIAHDMVDCNDDSTEPTTSTYRKWFNAACENDLKVLQKCLDNGVDIESTPIDKVSSYFSHDDWKIDKLELPLYPALTIAAMCNHFETVQYLLDQGANINAVGKRITTALHLTLLSDEQEMARFLILKGADVNLCDRNGITPLFMATSSSNFDMVYLLVLAGSNLKAKNGSKWSIAADQAKSLGHFGIHLFLVEDAPKIVKQLQRYQDECKRPDKNTYEIKKKRSQRILFSFSMHDHMKILKVIRFLEARGYEIRENIFTSTILDMVNSIQNCGVICMVMPSRVEEVSKFRLRVEYARLCNRPLLVTYFQSPDCLEYGLKLIIKEECIIKLIPDGNDTITVNSPICSQIRSLTRLNINDCTQINKEMFTSYDIIGQYNITSKIRKCALPVDDSCDIDSFVVNHNHDDKNIQNDIEQRRHQLIVSKPNSVEIVISPPNAELEKAHNIEREMLLMSKYYDSLSRSDSLPAKLSDGNYKQQKTTNIQNNHSSVKMSNFKNETIIESSCVKSHYDLDNDVQQANIENGKTKNPDSEFNSTTNQTECEETSIKDLDECRSSLDKVCDDNNIQEDQEPSHHQKRRHHHHTSKHESSRHRSNSIKEKRKRMRSKVMKTSQSNDDDSMYEGLDDTSGKETNFDSHDNSSDFATSPPSSFDMFSDRESISRSPRDSLYSLNSFLNGYYSEKDDDKLTLTATTVKTVTKVSNGTMITLNKYQDDNVDDRQIEVDKAPNDLPLEPDAQDNHHSEQDISKIDIAVNNSIVTISKNPVSFTLGCDSDVESPSGNHLSDDQCSPTVNDSLNHQSTIPLICIDEISACSPSSTLNETIYKRHSGLKNKVFNDESGLNFLQWSCDDVVNWLQEITLAQYDEKFRAADIDGIALFELWKSSVAYSPIEFHQVLKDSGVLSPGHRLKLKHHLHKLKDSFDGSL
ncbi:Ankyrin-3 [Trichoplax sp. H2]|nr:Ankyrin-3 [Trichoplax sp. H2]|eukprot:RDD40348.1 Ankyrin-3 [Trichoplax sp. H2]